ncbi:hypothetical protein K2X05_07400 [bacterium]|nr:hypothetical protein [bacterium]
MDAITEQKKVFNMGWLDPRTGQVFEAGVAVFNQMYGEYYLKILEEDSSGQYFLKPVSSDGTKASYRVERVLKNNRGFFVKRSNVGDGYSSFETNGNIFINYGSKYKTLVIYTED